ncbi:MULTISPECIES: S66 peptidase family protein [Sphingobacterium]|uniref:LD-carboxypeptidase n=1 Tax=Sphingobacterium multivorum TaxID=28454 RepID=A0ABX7CIR7_SPHMU|nr:MULTISPECIES: LD-carboxypeptidase [Sphingobacterium]QQT32184.1 LD-carboxypeptidase [Sphingobacterium multivorum]QQT51896.1 LD-carboxypeptidase [Sphingobacterium multivorum]QRY56951.1 LD-carboxypeptidase [Sphingobacterium siyangense]
MEKRAFLKSIALSVLSIPVLGMGQPTGDRAELYGQAALLATRLKLGDTIGLITPAGVLDDEESISIAREIFETLGFKVKEGKHIRSRYGNLAGTDQERIADIHDMFADKTVKAIVCIRGGSGTSRLLDRLDYRLIANNPKILLGYSDITALILALYAKTGLITFHGAVGISTWTKKLAEAFNAQFVANQPAIFENPKSKGDSIVQTKDRIATIHPGIVDGVLLGGNMTVLTGLCGSPYLPDFKDKILFLEEVDEDMERVDRMFCQLKNAGVLGAIKGFIFGKCTNCKPSGGYGSVTLDQLFNDYIKPLKIPAYTGAVVGHIAEQFILPVGAKVRVDASQGTIALMEPALKD